jgi:hypothetical protein
MAISLFALLRSGYTGPAFKVRRASDNTTQDIYWVGRTVDIPALAAFCTPGGTPTNGFIDTAYDQTSSARHISQGTAASQPKIWDSSTGLVTLGNGRIAALFDGSNDSLTNLSFGLGSSGDPACTFAWSQKMASFVGSSPVSMSFGSNTAGHCWNAGYASATSANIGNNTGANVFTVASMTARAHAMIALKALNAQASLYRLIQDGAEISPASNVSPTSHLSLSASNGAIGTRQGGTLPANDYGNCWMTFATDLGAADIDVVSQELLRHF